MPRIFAEAFRDLLQWQNEIDGAGRDGAARHPLIFGLVGILGDDETAHFLDRLGADAAIVAGAGKDDANGTLAEILGERLQQHVEGHAHGFMPLREREAYRAIANREIASRWDDIDAIGFDPHTIARFSNRHGRVCGQDLGHHARMFGIKVLDHDEGQAALRRYRRQKGAKRLEPASRGAQRHNRKGGRLAGDDLLLRRCLGFGHGVGLGVASRLLGL